MRHVGKSSSDDLEHEGIFFYFIYLFLVGGGKRWDLMNTCVIHSDVFYPGFPRSHSYTNLFITLTLQKLKTLAVAKTTQSS